MIILKHRLKSSENSHGIINHLPYNLPYTFTIRATPFFGKLLSIASVPLKACPGNCIHCKHGATSYQSVDRQSFYALRHNIRSLKEIIELAPDLDYVEVCGPGEVGLNAELNLLIDDIRKITSLPILIDSCGTLCWRISVHNDFCKADAVSIRIDAADRELYHTINQVHLQIPFERYLNGIRQFRNAFTGDLYIKTCFVDGINTDDASLYKLSSLLTSLRPINIFVSTNDSHINNKVIPAIDMTRLEYLSHRIGTNAIIVERTLKCA